MTAFALTTRFGTLALPTVTVCAPGVAPSVQPKLNTPAPLVRPLSGVTLPPPVVTAAATATPTSGWPSVAVRRTPIGVASAASGAAL